MPGKVGKLNRLKTETYLLSTIARSGERAALETRNQTVEWKGNNSAESRHVSKLRRIPSVAGVAPGPLIKIEWRIPVLSGALNRE